MNMEWTKKKNKMTIKDQQIMRGMIKRINKEYSNLGVGHKTGMNWEIVRNYLTKRIGIIH